LLVLTENKKMQELNVTTVFVYPFLSTIRKTD